MKQSTPGHDPDRPRAPAQPYLEWAVATGFVYQRPGNWLPLLVEFDPTLPRAGFVSLSWLRDGLRPAVRVPALFADRLPPGVRALPGFNFCVLMVDRKQAAAVLNDSTWRQTIRRCELGPPVDLPRKGTLASPSAAPTAPPSASPSAARAATATRSPPRPPRAGRLRRWICSLFKVFRSSPAAPPAGPPSTNPGQRVVVAVIDRGIAFAHSRFGTASGTRIAHLWQQDNMVGATSMSNSPGHELSSAAIDNAVQHARAAGAGEDEVYRRVGGLRFDTDGYKALARRRSHGTHVLDLAAGYEPQTANSDRPIIAIDMPDDAIADPAGSTLAIHAMWGLVYIMEKVEAMRGAGETLPVVVNISYGPHEGPHDGTSLLEVVMDTLITAYRSSQTPLRVVLAAGNYRQSRAHANFDLAPAIDNRTLHWRLQPCGLTPSFMEIWFPDDAAVEVTLRSPQGRAIAVPTSGSPVQEPPGGSPVMHAQYVAPSPPSQRAHICLTIAPTAPDTTITSGHPVAPSGLWSVQVHNRSAGPINVDAWIKRSDTPAGRRAKGRQSYFDDPEHLRHWPSGRPMEFDPPVPVGYVRRQGTLSGIATGTETHVIGAYRRGPQPADWMPADYSSEGPVAPNATRTMKAPNWLAPGDDGLSCPGVLAAGTRSGARVAMRGTSVAAPQATRHYADEFASSTAATAGSLQPPSTAVPNADRVPVAGDGLMPLNPPPDRLWKDRP